MKILVADDHTEYCQTLQEHFARHGWETITAHTTVDALNQLDRHYNSLSLILLDVEFKGEDRTGIDVLVYAQKRYPFIPVVMISGYGTVETAAYATKLGAENFFDKASMTASKLIEMINSLATNRHSVEEIDKFKFLADNGIIAQSKVMLEVADAILRVARSNLNVLITGETGTGKRLVAEAIHRASLRCKNEFVPVPIPSVNSDTLFTSEMFGHKRGAFTGADQDKRGFFHKANNGTLFLDEIGELLPINQTRLLVPIEERRFYPVGSLDEVRVNIRFISATDKDLVAAIKNGTFSSPLYYRLREFEIKIPPLRERREDIKPIAQHTLQSQLKETGAQSPKGFTPSAIEYLESLDWPGNVRQLINTVKQCTVIASGQFITKADIIKALDEAYVQTEEQATAASRENGSLEQARMSAECDAIIAALKETDGNVTRAAALLDISRETLYSKMKRCNIDPRQFRT